MVFVVFSLSKVLARFCSFVLRLVLKQNLPLPVPRSFTKESKMGVTSLEMLTRLPYISLQYLAAGVVDLCQ